MRDIYVRHRPRCRYAQPEFADAKGRAPRTIFGCGCPIYARVRICDPVTKGLLFQYNGSLKGITAKEAAEELVQNWFVNYLSGEKPAAHEQKAAVTIIAAVEKFLELKRGALPPPKAVVVSDAVRMHRARARVDVLYSFALASFPAMISIARSTEKRPPLCTLIGFHLARSRTLAAKSLPDLCHSDSAQGNLLSVVQCRTLKGTFRERV